MQKLEERNTCTPTDIPHVSGNCDLSLNREETLSVSGLKTFSNNSDAALTGLERYQNRTCEFLLYKLLIPLTNEHEPVIVTTGCQLRRGTHIHTLNSVVSATSAPHGVL